MVFFKDFVFRMKFTTFSLTIDSSYHFQFIFVFLCCVDDRILVIGATNLPNEIDTVFFQQNFFKISFFYFSSFCLIIKKLRLCWEDCPKKFISHYQMKKFFVWKLKLIFVFFICSGKGISHFASYIQSISHNLILRIEKNSFDYFWRMFILSYFIFNSLRFHQPTTILAQISPLYARKLAWDLSEVYYFYWWFLK